MTADNIEMHYPDYYQHPEYYTNYGPKVQSETHAALMKMHNNPNAEVTVYRAAPPEAGNKINPGDWVTTSKAYAEQHAAQDDDPKNDWPITSTKAKASDLFSEGNEVNEWGYDPKPASASVAARKRNPNQTSMPITSPKPAQTKVDLARMALEREQAKLTKAQAGTDSHAISVAMVRTEAAQKLHERRVAEYRSKFGQEPK